MKPGLLVPNGPGLGWGDERFPAGNRPGPNQSLHVRGDTWEQSAQFYGAGQLAAVIESCADRGGIQIGDDEHARSMGIRIEVGKYGQRESCAAAPPAVVTAWRGFAGLCDIVAHQYFGLELPLLWPTITDELPLLILAVRAEIARLPDEG